jgi:hypothetical protein
MIAPRIALLVAALVLIASVDLFAQQEPPVAPGDRVRVTAPTIDPDPFVGTFVSMGADTCVLLVEGRAEALALPFASVTSLEVSRGRKSYALAGAGIGLAAGAVVGVAIASGTEEGEYEGLARFVSVAGGTGIGLVIGTVVGASIKTERWEFVDLQPVRVSITPLGIRGLAVSMSVTF